ncbi:MAG: 3'-5' exonuclease, partial [Phycisphaerales bacterium]
QWTIIDALSQDFFAGESKRATSRSLFAVGDPKQSIYSFQGAEPEAFDRMRRQFGGRIEAARQPFADIRLGLSFRSTPHVLRAVDRVFDSGPASAGLGPAERYTHHEALRHAAPGRVEIWPTEVPVETEEADAWDAPLDAPRLDAPEVRLARRIAACIRRWLDTGTRLEGTGRTIRPKDIMILVRKRSPFAEPMIRALKERLIPVAGADRLAVTAHIAVQDLMALGRFCLLPADDLSLAAVLKSPLFGLGEEDLFALCHDRAGSLAEALEAGALSEPRLSEIATSLARWRDRARARRPFDFYSEVLTSGGGFRAYAKHLGVEAEEALDAFLVLARDFERVDTPTLPGFLSWLAAGETELKRDMEQHEDTGDGAVRVMTVHGAKGLEAPIVFLPDTCTLPTDRNDSPVFEFPGPDPMGPPDALIWVPRRDMESKAVGQLREARREAKLQEY